jgi:dihydroxyacid dehydratase/phosphogluconate dehydratase
MARRSGVPLTIDAFDDAARETPVLANIRPGGTYLMEDFFYAGGLPGLLAQIDDLLHLDRPTVAGITLREAISTAEVYDEDVIRPREKPITTEGGLAVLRGNLAPDGAVIKHMAADPTLLVHTGPAVVFDGYKDLLARIDDDDLPVTEDSVLVLREAGPQGGPGMPEHGMLPIPKKLLRDGVRDMVRVSDARMSGTSYGACVLHVAPEAHVGGPLALVRDGDPITLDVPARRLSLDVSDEELARRRAEWTPPAPMYPRGYGALHAAHILQADAGCDFDFLAAPGKTPEPDAR